MNLIQVLIIALGAVVLIAAIVLISISFFGGKKKIPNEVFVDYIRKNSGVHKDEAIKGLVEQTELSEKQVRIRLHELAEGRVIKANTKGQLFVRGEKRS